MTVLAAPASLGVYIETEPDPTFGLFHGSADGPRSDVAVLICPPFGWEEFCSYRSRRAWADDLARNGHPTLRIDLPATGDSGGSPRDPQRLEAWSAAVAASASWLRAETGSERVVAIGIGLGGLVACHALAGGAALDDLVLWAVPARGRTFLRELRAFARLNATEVDATDAAPQPAVPEPPPLPDGSFEVGGFLLSAETIEALEQLDLTSLAVPEARGRRVLMLERDGIGVDARLRDHFHEAGAAVSVVPGPGYGAMMAHPQEASPPEAEIARVSAWLAEASRPAPSRSECGAHRTDVELLIGDRRVRETPVTVQQPFGRLAGVLATPADAPPVPLCAVLLNAGALRRIGPGRMWVELARRWAARGVPTLRLDLEGLGDADGDAAPYADTAALYVLELVDQVLAALDELQDRGLPSRFALAGLCSGAYWSFHAALGDERVSAGFLLNPRALFWDHSLEGARDARKIGEVLSGTSWRRVLRGEVPAARLRAILVAALLAPARSRARRKAGRARRGQLDQALAQLRDAGKHLLFVFGGNEPLHDELEREGRLDGWPNLELELLPGRDHSFRPIRSQQYVHAVLDQALDQELARAGGVERPADGASPSGRPRG